MAAVLSPSLFSAASVSSLNTSKSRNFSLSFSSKTFPVIRSADGPVRKPSPIAPTPPKPIAPTPPSPIAPVVPIAQPSPVVESKTPSTSTSTSGVTIEYQRQRAKELIAYFEDKKYEEQVIAGRVFGWTRKNEISNGRWTMFGLAVGLLTELATGVNFPDQLKIIASNLGIFDFDF